MGSSKKEEGNRKCSGNSKNMGGKRETKMKERGHEEFPSSP